MNDDKKALMMAVAAPIIPAIIDFMRSAHGKPKKGNLNADGKIVRVNFNRNVSDFPKRKDEHLYPPQRLRYYCYAIRPEKTSDRMLGYSEDFAIKNAIPAVNPLYHYRVSGHVPEGWKGSNIDIQGTSRSVFSFLKGRAIPISELPNRPPDGFAHYSPFPPGIPPEYWVIPNRKKDLARFEKGCPSLETFPRLQHADYVHFTQGRFDCGIAPILLWGIKDKDGNKIVGENIPYNKALVILQRQNKSSDRQRYGGPPRTWLPSSYH